MFSSSYADTPEEIAVSYFDLLKQHQWAKAAELYDSLSLAEFKEMMSFLLEIPDENASQVLGSILGPGSTKASFKSMSDIAFFSIFLEKVMEQASKVGELQFDKVNVLGSIMEGDSVQHVLVRTNVSIGDVTLESMEVISFKKTGGDWKILMQGKIKGMAQQLRKAFENR